VRADTLAEPQNSAGHRTKHRCAKIVASCDFSSRTVFALR
jgi:hypothetical protein